MIRRRLHVLLALALALVLSACGFHLRDSLALPADLGPVRVRSVDRYSPLADMLEASLERVGARIASEDDPDAAVLHLLSERWGDTPISVDQFGRAQEYSLRYAVVFELRKADGTTPLPRQTIELSRDYISNPVRAIGTEGEREILARELRREMGAAILRRLNAVAVGDGQPAAASLSEQPIADEAARAAIDPAIAVPPPESAGTVDPVAPAGPVDDADQTTQDTTAPEPPPSPAPR